MNTLRAVVVSTRDCCPPFLARSSYRMPRRPVIFMRAFRVRKLPRLSRVLSSVIGLGLALAPPAAAQGTTTYGGFGGRVESRQLHSHDNDSETRSDVVLGAFVDVATPVSWLHIVLEGSVARRGGDYEVATAGGPTTQSARIDYLSFSLSPTVWHDFGRFALYMSLGFARDQDLQIGSTAELAPLFTEPASGVLALVAAAGVEVSIMRVWSARLEVRELNQVSPAFRPPSGDIRHRSREFVVKVGMRPGA